MSSKSKSRTTRVATPTIAAPQTAAECDALILRLGVAQRRRQAIETEMNEHLAKVRESYERDARTWADENTVWAERTQAYCEAHRAELTADGKRKTYRFGSGEVQWRMRPPSVSVRAVEAVIDALKKLGLGRFVRVREEIDKEAVLREPEVAEQVKGLGISQREDFVVKPWDTELEQVL
jgi:phage host-nuclease inhibitor protein Gam